MSVVQFKPARLVPHNPTARGFDPIRYVYLVRLPPYPWEKFVAIRAANVRQAARMLGTILAGLAQLRVRRYRVDEFYRAINNLENGEYAP